jgi:hypothetical protein
MGGGIDGRIPNRYVGVPHICIKFQMASTRCRGTGCMRNQTVTETIIIIAILYKIVGYNTNWFCNVMEKVVVDFTRKEKLKKRK